MRSLILLGSLVIMLAGCTSPNNGARYTAFSVSEDFKSICEPAPGASESTNAVAIGESTNTVAIGENTNAVAIAESHATPEPQAVVQTPRTSQGREYPDAPVTRMRVIQHQPVTNIGGASHKRLYTCGTDPNDDNTYVVAPDNDPVWQARSQK